MASSGDSVDRTELGLGDVPRMPEELWARIMDALAADMPADLSLLPEEGDDPAFDDDAEPEPAALGEPDPGDLVVPWQPEPVSDEGARDDYDA
ncbi:MAG: hypothetical protein ACQEWM_06890 [Actinomycetota bacterium]